MTTDLRDFWGRFQYGIEVAVASSSSHKLLGVRDGFLRYVRAGLRRDVPVAVVPQGDLDQSGLLPLTDEECVYLARREAVKLREKLEDEYHFYVAAESGMDTVTLGDDTRYFVRNWTVVLSPAGEAWGASGSVQLPEGVVEEIDEGRIPRELAVTRRGPGIVSGLTGGLENRRTAVAQATVHALSSLFYGRLESRS